MKKKIPIFLILFLLLAGFGGSFLYTIKLFNPIYNQKDVSSLNRIKSTDSTTDNILRVSMVGDIETLDPVDSWYTKSNNLINQITEPLFWSDIASQSSPDEPIQIIPFLAKNYTYNDDNTNLTINLRKGITFHDGEKFNASSAVYSLERLIYLTNSTGTLTGTQIAITWSMYYFSDGTPIMKSVKKTGDYQINITLNAPYGPFITLLSYTASHIVSPNTPKDSYLDYSTDILVGTGPFEMVNYAQGVEAELKKNENWWGGIKDDGTSIGSIYWDEIFYEISQDQTSAEDALLDGNVSFCDFSSFRLSEAKCNPNITVKEWGPALTFFYWTINCKKFSRKLRVAIAYSLNYSHLTKTLRNGFIVKADSCLPSTFPAHNSSVKPPDFNKTRARELMQEMYPGAPTDLFDDLSWTSLAEDNDTALESIKLFRHEGSTFNELLNEMVASNLVQIGINTTEDIQNWSTFQDWTANQRDNLEFWYNGWNPDFLNEFRTLDPLYNPNSNWASHQAWVSGSDISTEYQNTVVTWLNAMKEETNTTKRHDYAKMIQSKLFHGEDAFLPQIPMFYDKIIYTYNRSLNGISFNGLDSWYWASTSRIYNPPLLYLQILSPSPGHFFGHEPPKYSLKVKQGSVDNIWYSLDNGKTNHSGSLSGEIHNETWYNLTDGSIKISFYASNSEGDKISSSVSVIKDTKKPSISIILPEFNKTYGKSPPSFEVEIDEVNLDKTWYLLNNSSEKYFFTSNGTINETAWNNVNDGEIAIKFFANDSIGLESSKSVSVIKDSDATSDDDGSDGEDDTNGDDLTNPLEIPGFDIIYFFPVLIIGVSFAIWQIKRKNFD